MNGARILAIDDNPAVLGLLSDVLSDLGYSPHLMDRPPNRLEQITAINPDVIVLDLAFEGGQLDGWRLLQRLRGDPRTYGIPVVLCTASAEEIRGREQWLAGHRVWVVVKPFELGSLEGALRHALLAGPRPAVGVSPAADRGGSASGTVERRSGTEEELDPLLQQ